MTIYFKSGDKLRDKLKPNVDKYTRQIDLSVEDLTVKQILESIELSPAYVAYCYVDNSFQRLDYVPKDGDIITLQTPVSGG